MKITGNNYNFLLGYNNKDNNSAIRKKLDEQRKDDPVLDRALYQSDMAELMSDMGKADAIARKAAKGGNLTEEEKKFMEDFDPEQLKKAEKAKEEAKRIKESMKNASSKEEAQGIMMQALTTASQMMKNGDAQFGKLLIEAIKNETEDGNGTNDSRVNQYNNKKDKGRYFEASI